MKIKYAATAIVSLSLLASQASFANDDQKLLNSFHQYGIKKCDAFILENSKLTGNWNYYINKHAGGIDGDTTEVTLTRIWGSKGDTVKTEDTYIQTAKNCYVRTTWTLTNSGTCSSNIDGDLWYISRAMPDNDYTTYKNAGGIEMHAKEISMGNFKACIQEGSKRDSSPHG